MSQDRKPTIEEIEALIKREREHPDYRYVLKSLTKKMTVAEAEAKYMVSDSRLGPEPVPFGFSNREWRVLLAKMQSGDELWEYSNIAGALSGGGGLAVIRGSEVAGAIMTWIS